MKIFLKIITILVVSLGFIDTAMGAISGGNCFAVRCMTNEQIRGCSSIQCYGKGYDISCATCQTGYTLREIGTQQAEDGCTFTYKTCEAACTGCTNCVSDSNWSNHSTGYEKKVTRTCDCNTCKSTTSYRCSAGYYGMSKTGTSGCTKCPEPGTSEAGKGFITDCYIPAGVDMNAPSGTFHYTSACYY